ncbi:hypothetical protein Q31b_19000 [Novipirellula aureliae]|uniref:Uncharacterized protein n=1 Tax=Novipirellula aureliae TaxID=2527966 RepID=A0A5C6E6Z9_9BACT|nr:hypothetical protein [Novipirellula aureliae]TWU44364.1 hypothetical protein Q31b_19000 [Novipirellula aureliae]
MSGLLAKRKSLFVMGVKRVRETHEDEHLIASEVKGDERNQRDGGAKIWSWYARSIGLMIVGA